MYRLFVGKDVHKFSCAHMTVFPDGSKERIHGHNFHVSLALELSSERWDQMVDFGVVKKNLQAQCDAWTERLLLAENNPHFSLVREQTDELEFTLCGKRYVVPRDEAILLPLENIVVESLAVLFAQNLRTRLRETINPGVVTGLEVTITESSAQGSTYRCAF